MSEALEKSRLKWLQFGLLVLLSGLSALLMVDVQGIPEMDQEVGETASRAVVTPIDLNFVDEQATAQGQQVAVSSGLNESVIWFVLHGENHSDNWSSVPRRQRCIPW